MELNENYDTVRSHILVLDPLPFVNKAYPMILRVEKQKTIQTNYSENLDNSVMIVKTAQGDMVLGIKRRILIKKDDRQCDHCKGIGHTRDNCFKIHGYPEWYKQLKKEKGSASKVQVNMANNPLKEEQMLEKKGGGTKLSPVLSDGLQ